MTEFICGVQNTGKSTLICNRIRDDLRNGKRVILIVPDQEALSAEANLAEVCRDTQTYDLKVYGFSRLADDVFRTYGGICYDYVDKTGASLALFLSVCSVAPYLKVYKNVTASDRALISELLETVRGFKRQGISPADLEAASKADMPELLRDKLSDMCLIYAAYVSTMKNSGGDPDDDTERMYKTLCENGGFSGYTVYIDSFVSFTGVQLKVIELMMKTAEKLTVTLGAPVSAMGGERGSVLSPIRDTYKKLAAAANRFGGYTHTDLTERYAAEELGLLEKALRGCAVKTDEAMNNIRIFRAKTCYEEADTVAADIKDKLMNGARCRDIAVITENLQKRKGVIDAALEKYGVPYFMSVRDDVRQKSLFRFIQSAISVCTGNFRPEDVSAYIRSGLTGLPSKELDLFGDYIRRRNIKKAENYTKDFAFSPDSFGAPQNDAAKAKLDRINAVRAYVVTPLYDFCKECEKCGTASEITDAVIKLTVNAGVPETLRGLIKEAAAEKNDAEAQETAQLWDVFLKVTKQIRTLCKDLPMKPAQYSMLLDTVLSQTTVGKIPTSIDEVTVGESGMIRAKGVKHVYVIGCNEGEFPASASDTGLIDDKEKEYLERAGLELESNTEKIIERKAYDFYKSACISSETVTFSYCTLGYDESSAEKNMCGMLSRVKEAMPGIPVVSELPDEAMCSSEEAAFEYYAEHADTDRGRAVERIFSEKPEYADKIRALSEALSNTDGSLGKETVDLLIPKEFTISPTRLKSFLGCSIRHYCGYFLKLGSDAEIEFSNLDFGTFVHLILKKLTDDYIKDESTADFSDEHLSEYTEEFITGYLKEELGIDVFARGFKRLRAQIKRLCKSVAAAEREVLNEFKYGRFKPYKTELRIGRNSVIHPVAMPAGDGRTVSMTGQIDRVDVFQDGGKTYIKLVDYKTGKADFSISGLDEGEGVQLFIYMIDAISSVGPFPSPVPAALYYMKSATKEKTAEKASDIGASEQVTRNGVALDDENVTEALGAAVNGPGVKKKEGAIGKILLQSEEKMNELFDKVRACVTGAVTKMAEGKLLPPEKIDGNGEPCKYCEFSPYCRFTERKGRG
ncbi:MAG: PD-(D/E)XK nuclease family protein [Clostridia bacterium]|nr:PD-(D/E)XK nuclease family protein [Clostridia bacterium]